MRNQLLTGYLLHHKPYQEKRALYYFFTQSHGIVHGMGKKGMPLFVPIQLFATGKRQLKSFSQIQPLSLFNEATLYKKTFHETDVSQTPRNQITGQNIYAGFYLNEIIWKLLGVEDAMPHLWCLYQHCLDCLRKADLNNYELRLLLRNFERVLFDELGYAIDFQVDSQNKVIVSDLSYCFSPESGFECFNPDSNHTKQPVDKTLIAVSLFSGQSIIEIDEYLQQPLLKSLNECSLIKSPVLHDWSRLYKQFIDYLLGHKPLKSRELWINFSKLT